MFLDFLRALILGIVEGITEWLPISSTGHLILVQEFTGTIVSPEFEEMFDVVIQLGAILAVIVLFFHKLNPFSPSKSKEEKKQTFTLWYKVIIACIPAAVIGLPLDDWLDEHLYNAFVVALTLIIYGVWFIIIESGKKKEPTAKELEQLTYKQALIIGAFQVLALIPGTSRSGSTIIGGMIAGCSRFVAAEFTFFLAIPIMFGRYVHPRTVWRACSWYDSFVCCKYTCYPFPFKLYQEKGLQSLWYIQNSAGYTGAFVLYVN